MIRTSLLAIALSFASAGAVQASCGVEDFNAEKFFFIPLNPGTVDTCEDALKEAKLNGDPFWNLHDECKQKEGTACPSQCPYLADQPCQLLECCYSCRKSESSSSATVWEKDEVGFCVKFKSLGMRECVKADGTIPLQQGEGQFSYVQFQVEDFGLHTVGDRKTSCSFHDEIEGGLAE